MARLSIRIDFDPAGGVLGPGMAQLLDQIAASGSIRQAATVMDMSYRKAWLLLQAMQETFGAPVVIASTGGATGGGARLTDLGLTLLRSYRRIEVHANRGAAPELRLLASLAKAGVAPTRYGRKKKRKKASKPQDS